MISVLFLIPTLDRGGAENVLVDLVNHMDQSKFKITVQTLFDQDSQKDRLRDGIEYRTFLKHQFHGNSRLQAFLPAKLLYRLIVRKRYDIVVSYLEGPTTHILSGCPYPDSKKVAWFHSALTNDRGFHAGFSSKEAAIRAYRQFDLIAFVARTVRETIEKTAGEQFARTCVLYNTLNTDVILKGAEEEFQECPFSDREFNIVSAGKITPVKGYDRLARVQKMLRDAGYPTHVYILGTGPARKEIESYLQKNDLSKSFSFLGFQENPYQYVARADLFVCSSRREGFSTAVSEALVLGVPVISTNCSGAKELLGERNEFGVVTENEEQTLFEGIVQLVENRDLLAHYRVQAKERGNHFQMNSTVLAVEKEFLQLVEG